MATNGDSNRTPWSPNLPSATLQEGRTTTDFENDSFRVTPRKSGDNLWTSEPFFLPERTFLQPSTLATNGPFYYLLSELDSSLPFDVDAPPDGAIDYLTTPTAEPEKCNDFGGNQLREKKFSTILTDPMSERQPEENLPLPFNAREYQGVGSDRADCESDVILQFWERSLRSVVATTPTEAEDMSKLRASFKFPAPVREMDSVTIQRETTENEMTSRLQQGDNSATKRPESNFSTPVRDPKQITSDESRIPKSPQRGTAKNPIVIIENVSIRRSPSKQPSIPTLDPSSTPSKLVAPCISSHSEQSIRQTTSIAQQPDQKSLSSSSSKSRSRNSKSTCSKPPLLGDFGRSEFQKSSNSDSGKKRKRRDLFSTDEFVPTSSQKFDANETPTHSRRTVLPRSAQKMRASPGDMSVRINDTDSEDEEKGIHRKTEINDDDDPTPEGEFIVYGILDKKTNLNGHVEYQVEWKPVPPSQVYEKTWEPSESLRNSSDLVQRFERRWGLRDLRRHRRSILQQNITRGALDLPMV